VNPRGAPLVQNHMLGSRAIDEADPNGATRAFPGVPRWGCERALLLLCTLALSLGCAPKVALEVPKEPITINLNVKIEHEIRIQVDRELEDLFAEEDELF
jgi:hypothetical protein